ncbi:uncharacterized protein VK521_011017 [Ammospiza maritima maritima]
MWSAAAPGSSYSTDPAKGQLQNQTREKHQLAEAEPVICLGAAGAGSSQPQGSGRAMPDSFAIHFLKVLRELLAFVLFSYTVLLGALLLAGWTTYFLVLK